MIKERNTADRALKRSARFSILVISVVSEKGIGDSHNVVPALKGGTGDSTTKTRISSSTDDSAGDELLVEDDNRNQIPSPSKKSALHVVTEKARRPSNDVLGEDKISGSPREKLETEPKESPQITTKTELHLPDVVSSTAGEGHERIDTRISDSHGCPAVIDEIQQGKKSAESVVVRDTKPKENDGQTARGQSVLVDTGVTQGIDSKPKHIVQSDKDEAVVATEIKLPSSAERRNLATAVEPRTPAINGWELAQSEPNGKPPSSERDYIGINGENGLQKVADDIKAPNHEPEVILNGRDAHVVHPSKSTSNRLIEAQSIDLQSQIEALIVPDISEESETAPDSKLKAPEQKPIEDGLIVVSPDAPADLRQLIASPRGGSPEIRTAVEAGVVVMAEAANAGDDGSSSGDDGFCEGNEPLTCMPLQQHAPLFNGAADASSYLIPVGTEYNDMPSAGLRTAQSPPRPNSSHYTGSNGVESSDDVIRHIDAMTFSGNGQVCHSSYQNASAATTVANVSWSQEKERQDMLSSASTQEPPRLSPILVRHRPSLADSQKSASSPNMHTYKPLLGRTLKQRTGSSAADFRKISPSPSTIFADDDDGGIINPRTTKRRHSVMCNTRIHRSSSRKKIVRFADTLGLDLESVAYIPDSDVEDDLYIPLSSDNEDFHDNEENEEFSYHFCFVQPGSEPDFLRRVLERNVVLERCISHRGKVYGSVRVANLGFEKNVMIRHTINNWLTSEDLPAQYFASRDPQTDRFVFVLPVPNYFNMMCRMSFCIRYQCAGNEYWDSNYGQNYTIDG